MNILLRITLKSFTVNLDRQMDILLSITLKFITNNVIKQIIIHKVIISFPFINIKKSTNFDESHKYKHKLYIIIINLAHILIK